MNAHSVALATILILPTLLGACATYGPPPPPPPGYVGESWGQHVRRCLRHYPRYNSRTDLIERPGGPVPCPL